MKLVKFPKDKIPELLSWIQNDEQKHFWSGNTFQEGLNEEIFSLHLKRDDVHALCFLDKKRFLVSYGEIVLSELSKGILCRVIIKPEKGGWELEKYLFRIC